ncbi:MAG: extracellular solute-binding protein [Minwuiales bacterium]|nr:extracellular solute-binding protein [Minwuiales bacterium]
MPLKIAAGAALAFAVALAGPAQAEVRTLHALSLIGEPKYGPDFTHLEFVNPDAPKGGTLRMAFQGGFDSLNPFIIKGDPAPAIGLTFETLMATPMDDVSAEYGLIAESVEVPEDLSFVIFNLRSEARFHDGSPITAEDVVFSFDTLVEHGRPLYRFYYQNVEKAEALSPSRVKFTFSGPRNRELPQIMGQLPVLSKAYWEERDFASSTLEPFLGSGPYRVTNIDPNRSVTMERVEDYWGKDLPLNRGRYNFDRIRFDSYRDASVQIEAFKAGEYDIRDERSSSAWATNYKFPAVEEGLVKLKTFEHSRTAGMQGYVYNLRRPVFQNRTLRRALTYAFDFEWMNKNISHGLLTRSRSFFGNSELEATGLPSPEELALLEPFRDQLPAEVFTEAYEPPSSDDPGGIRGNLRKAARMLKEAGYVIKDGDLIDPETNQPVAFEILSNDPRAERTALPFADNLKRLGVKATLRVVDSAQYVNRVRAFDFDMIVSAFGQSNSPGNEQRDFWGSAAADRTGSRNVIGIKDPAIDALIDKIIAAPDRPTLVTATKALDRVLQWGHYLIPQFHTKEDRVAYWDKFGYTENQASYRYDLFSWWVDAEKERALQQRRGRASGAQAGEN